MCKKADRIKYLVGRFEKVWSGKELRVCNQFTEIVADFFINYGGFGYDFRCLRAALFRLRCHALYTYSAIFLCAVMKSLMHAELNGIFETLIRLDSLTFARIRKAYRRQYILTFGTTLDSFSLLLKR